ncbi:MAG: tRNA uridine-5-carboxymethylaminomethyl(34) synthesis enzyme MnmG, partial [Clostridia bacterium]|nr:tRNA uridine-5-carboxymethylaminomethyl(34) synthesis enzyme MnmG [Clostridia bacterium]
MSVSTYHAGEADVAVIGAGHAGIEAALAAARLGAKTLCFTINLDAVGNMPCNPAIGGPGKSQLVREIDALGGEMARAADACCIQYRMLNMGKGPAVRSIRAQADRRRYQAYMKHTMETCPNLRLIQAEICSVSEENGRVTAVTTATGATWSVKAVIIATGTFLGGRIIIGDYTKESGPDGMFAATELTSCLEKLGVPLRRFKTGTPPRVNRLSLDLSKAEPQYGDETVVPFSFSTETPPENREQCYLIYTNSETHRIIRENLHRSPLFSGVIKGVGPRYCPSIEDKLVRFADKDRHQLFVEPTGLGTEEMYVQGLSSSLPEEVQMQFLRTLPGFEKAETMRTAYAIEYDCVDPLALKPSLELKNLSGLYGAGQ